MNCFAPGTKSMRAAVLNTIQCWYFLIFFSVLALQPLFETALDGILKSSVLFLLSRLSFTFNVIYVCPQSDVANNPSQGSGRRLEARAKSEQKQLFCPPHESSLRRERKKVWFGAHTEVTLPSIEQRDVVLFTQSCKKGDLQQAQRTSPTENLEVCRGL